ncbi:MAG: hypothetical protein JWQ38_3236 [Flavipsychrobacter sp.]|nr:hypothetical protein [Flavipsychrobacter sp.]
MKKIMLMGAMALTVMSAKAQDFKTVLDKTFTAFDTTQDMNVKIEQSNKLGLIAKKFDNEWTSHYYLAYSKTVLSYMEKDAAKRDSYLDEADKERQDAVTILKKENDETYVLAAMIANARMVIDGMNRWQKYGKIFNEQLDNAKEQNPDNPRRYYLIGVSKFYTPKAFGGGKKIAQPFLEKAEGLLAKEQKTDITKPHWGMRLTEYYLAECKKDEKE